MIIPFPPGGTLDKVGRMLAVKMGEQFGQTFMVENRPGGNGVIGATLWPRLRPMATRCCSTPAPSPPRR
jgi:tripartite-type tricarboxylate transporter receptor subunit TctC